MKKRRGFVFDITMNSAKNDQTVEVKGVGSDSPKEKRETFEDQ